MARTTPKSNRYRSKTRWAKNRTGTEDNGRASEEERIPARKLPTDGIVVLGQDGKPDIALTLDRWAKEHAEKEREYVLYLDGEGNSVGYFEGEEDHIFIPDDIAVRSNVPYSMTAIHNHPVINDRVGIGGTFSDGDVAKMIKDELYEIQGTAREGRYYLVTSMDANPDGFANAVKRVARRIEKEAEKMYDTNTQSGNDDAIIYMQDRLHRWYTNNATKYGYAYRFVGEKTWERKLRG